MAGSRKAQTAGLVALAGALLAAGVALGVVAGRGPAPPVTMADRVRAVASSLRCPVCQDLSVADSPSGLATQIRGQIAQKLGAGESPQRIRQDYVRSYGEWILLTPPRRGVNLVAWLAPMLLLGAGLVLGLVAVWRWTPGRRGTSRRAAAGRGGPARAVLSSE